MLGAALITFAQERDDPLNGVIKELADIEGIFKEKQDVCQVDARWKVREEDIFNAFNIFQDRLRIFHYSGHAGSIGWNLNQDEFTAKISFVDGMAKNMGLFSKKSIKLVFLNGCSTADQAKVFLDHAASAVIATTYPIKDSVAYYFAFKFYASFCHRHSNQSLNLQDAFDAALNALESEYQAFIKPNGEVNPLFIDDNERGNFAPDEPEAKPYQLHLHPDFPEIGKETFADWMDGNTEVLHRKPSETHEVTSLGKSEDGYLLCDRFTEVQKFEEICIQKITGKEPRPIFFIYHDKHHAAPHSLPIRYRLFSLPKHCPQRFFFQAIDLPLPTEFGEGSIKDQNNPDRDKFQWVFSDNYYKHFGGKAATSEDLAVLTKRSSDEKLLLVHHLIKPQHWHDRRGNPEQAAELELRLSILMDWYVKSYSSLLKEQLGKHLIIVLTAKYLGASGSIPKVFADLANKYPDQVFNYHQLSNVIPEDIDDWQDDFLGDDSRTFLDPISFFETHDPGGDMELPLLKVKEGLIAEIRRYNQKHHANG